MDRYILMPNEKEPRHLVVVKKKFWILSFFPKISLSEPRKNVSAEARISQLLMKSFVFINENR